MAFSLKVRTQLLLILVLIISGFVIQVFIANVSQGNTAYILEKETDYLTRDSEINSQFNKLSDDVQDVLNIRLEDYIRSLTAEEQNLAIIRSEFVRESMDTTLDMLIEREEEQYRINEKELFQIPSIISFNSTLISNLNSVITTSNNSLTDLLSIQLNNFELILNHMENEANRINSRYVDTLEVFSIQLDDFQKDISNITREILLLEQAVIATDNLSYITDIIPITSAMVNDTLFMTQSLTDLNQQFLSDETIYDPNFGATFLNNTLERIDNYLNAITSNIINLNSSLLSSEFVLLDNIKTFNNNLGDSFLPLYDIAKEHRSVYEAITNFGTTTFISGVQSIIGQLIVIKSLFDVEHDNFQERFQLLLEDSREIANQLFLILSATIAIMVLFIILPIVVNIRNSIARVNRTIKLVSKGDLTIQKPKGFAGNEFGQLEEEIFNFIDSFRKILQELQVSSNYLADVSEELAAGTEESNASITEISTSLNTINHNASQQEVLIFRIGDKIRDLEELVNSTSQEISNASYLVSKISTRTNVLGLNAAISAAKAGKFASGFGIVADEIRELAQSSKQNSYEITELINKVNLNIKNSVNAIQNSVQEIKDLSNQTTKDVEVSSASADDQAIMLSEITDTSNSLAELASRLNNIIQSFKLQK